jgi:hypothetical protein
MKKYNGKVAGILGALIIHLIAGIIFMVVKLGSLETKEYSREYEIALQNIEAPADKEIHTKESVTTIENIFQDDQEILNIARNIANQPDVKINAEDYIDKVKDELIRSGKLGKDNYIDEQKRKNEITSGGNVSLERRKAEDKEAEMPKDSREMAANYRGPTRIYYNMANRNHTYLPLPIYKCEGSGKINLSIEVNQKGIVINAQIITGESTTSDPCLIETATNTAMISRFNPDIKAPRVQAGTLTYHFVAQ